MSLILSLITEIITLTQMTLIMRKFQDADSAGILLQLMLTRYSQLVNAQVLSGTFTLSALEIG